MTFDIILYTLASKTKLRMPKLHVMKFSSQISRNYQSSAQATQLQVYTLFLDTLIRDGLVGWLVGWSFSGWQVEFCTIFWGPKIGRSTRNISKLSHLSWIVWSFEDGRCGTIEPLLWLLGTWGRVKRLGCLIGPAHSKNGKTHNPQTRFVSVLRWGGFLPQYPPWN